MNLMGVNIILLIQFVSQTFTIKFSDNDYALRRHNGKVYVQPLTHTSDIRIPKFYSLPVIVKRFHLNARPLGINIKKYSYSEIVKNVEIDTTTMPMPLSVKKITHYKYEGEGIKIEYPAYIADIREVDLGFIVNVVLFPFKYDEKKKALFKLDSCVLEFKLSEVDLQKSNVNKTKTSPLYLIISANDVIHGFDSLALWKRQKGYRVKMLTMEEIVANYSGYDDAEKLRNALKEYYSDSGLVYVLLGGDVEIVPARVAYAMTSEAHFADDEDSLRADLYYSALGGTWDFDGDRTYGEVEDSVDLYPDVYVGRVPVDDIEEAREFSRKLINYEKKPAAQVENALFFAQILWHEPYTNSGESKDYIDTTFMPDYYNITKLYEANGNETYESVISAMKDGQGILNHNGHGWWTGMWLNGSPNWEHLSNIDADTLKMEVGGILYSIGCWVGAFDREDAISEDFVLNPYGPVAMIANSRYGWGSPGNPLYGYSDKFDHNFFQKIFVDSLFHIGVAVAESKADYVPFSHWENVYRWHQYQINLLGDPEMEIHTKYEGEVLSDFPSYISPGTSLTFSVYNTQGKMIDNAKMSLTYGDSVYVCSYTNPSGLSTVSIPSEIPDSLLLIIYARNHKALERWVYTTTSVSIEGFDIIGDDSATYFYPAQEGTLKIIFSNMSEDTLLGFYVKFTDTNIEIDSDSVYIGNSILPDSSFSARVRFRIPPSFVSGDEITIAIETPWNSRVFKRHIVRPHIALLPISPLRLSIENSDTFKFVLYNHFSHDLHNTIAYLEEYLGIIPQEESVMIGTIHSNDSAIFSFVGYVFDSFPYIKFRIKNNAFLNDTLDIFYGVNPEDIYFDFENSLDGFYASGNWKRTTEKAYSGMYSMWCGNAGQYENNANDSLISPWFKIGYNPVLSFYMWYEAAIYGSDGIHVYYFVNGEWEELDYLGSGGALDNKGIVVGWSEYRYFLKGLKAGDSTRIMFVLTTDDSTVAEGFYIDYIKVSSSSYTYKVELNPRKSYIEMPTILTKNSFSFVYNLKEPPIVYMYNIQGQKVHTFILDKNVGVARLNISDLRKGIYIVLVSQNNETFVKKVVIYK